MTSAVPSKKHRHETSSSSLSEDSSSDSDSKYVTKKKKSQNKSTLRTLTKQLQYDGKSNWLPFKHRFTKYAESSDWTAEECLGCFNRQPRKKEASLEDWADIVLTLSFKEMPEKYSNQQGVARFCHGLNDAEGASVFA